MNKEEILRKAYDIIKEDNEAAMYNAICKRANVCPDCGTDLDVRVFESLKENGCFYSCPKCDFRKEYWKLVPDCYDCSW